MQAAGDINQIMGDSAASGSSQVAGPTYDIWYLLKVLLVLMIIVGVFDYVMNRRKIKSEKEGNDKK